MLKFESNSGGIPGYRNSFTEIKKKYDPDGKEIFVSMPGKLGEVFDATKATHNKWGYPLERERD